MRKLVSAAVAVVLACVFALGGAAPASAMPLFVTIDGDEPLTLDVESSDSVQQVKHKIRDETDIPVDDQALLYDDLVLEDGRTLGDYDIPADATLTLVAALQWIDTDLTVPVVNEPYEDGVAARGGGATYAVSAGTLPAGLSLDGETGSVSGTPTAPGAYAFTLTASNLLGTISHEFAGEIAPEPTPTATATATATPTPSSSPTPTAPSTTHDGSATPPPATTSPARAGEDLAPTGVSMTIWMIVAGIGAIALGLGTLALTRRPNDR
ncbi:MAG: ubiquitin-like protein [Pseudoclavibacter sp.]